MADNNLARIYLGDLADQIDPDAAAHVMNMMGGSLSELESDLKRKADDDDGGIQHNADAVDYADEAEVIEDADETQQQRQRMQSQAAPMHAPKPIAVDDDIDFDSPQDAKPAASMQPTAAAPIAISPLISINRPPAPQGTSSLLTIGSATPLISIQPMAAAPAARQPPPVASSAPVVTDPKYFSSLHVPGGPAFKFTDMFHGAIQTVATPKPKQIAALKAVIDGDIDEYDIFDEPADESDPLWNNTLLSAADDAENGSSLANQRRTIGSGSFSLLEDHNMMMMGRSTDAKPPAPSKLTAIDLEPVQHMYWEQDIIWDTAQSTAASAAAASSSMAVADVASPNPNADDEDEAETQATTSAALSNRMVNTLFPESVTLKKPPPTPRLAETGWGAMKKDSSSTTEIKQEASNEDRMQVDEPSRGNESLEQSAGASLRDHLVTEDLIIDMDEMEGVMPSAPLEIVLSSAPFPLHAASLPRAVVDLNDNELVVEDIGASEATEPMSEGSDDESGDDEVDAANPAEGAAEDGEAPRRKKRRHLQLPGRPISAAELALRRRQEALKKLDRFNLSNDKHYITASVAQKVRTEMKLRHSSAAYRIAMAKTKSSQDELLHFHKPRPQIRHNYTHSIHLAEAKKKSRDLLNLEVVRHKKDLSARDGRVVLTEYSEEFPPLIMMVGMGSYMRNYYRKLDDHDVHAESKLATLGVVDGEVVPLEPTENSPFLGNIQKGTYVQSLENDLFKAPIFRHEPAETDFLLVRYGDKSPKWVIREVTGLYTVGQEQPLVEVPAPNSRQAQGFITKRLQQFIFHLFGPKRQPAVKLSDVASAFPLVSDNALRKQLKTVADFIRGGDDSGSWILKDNQKLPSEAEIRDLVTLEEICAFDSMLAGQERLQKLGIKSLTNVSPQLTQAVQSIPDDHPLKEVATFVEQELQLTPWNLTSNFVLALSGQALLQLSGFGDPSGRGEAFSYLRMALKIPPKKVEEKEKEQKVVVHQTDADLRKLHLKEAQDILRRWGVPEAEILAMKRWRVIGKIRELSTKLKETGEGSYDDNKFARGNRHSVMAHQQQYNEKCQSIFENQIQALSSRVPPPVEVVEEVDDDLLGALDSAVSNKGEKKKPGSGLRRILQGRTGDRSSAREADEEREAMERALRDESEGASGRDTAPIPEASSQTSSQPTVTNVEPAPLPQVEKHETYYVKRTVRRADGTAVVEIIKDKITVEEYLKKHSYNPKKAAAASAKRANPKSDSDKKGDKSDKPKKRSKSQTTAATLLKNAHTTLPTLPGFNPGMSCTNCKLVGHCNGSMLCPKPDPFNPAPQPTLDTEIAAVQQWRAFYEELIKVPGFKEGPACTACSLPGHVRTNRSCPKYDPDALNSRGAEPDVDIDAAPAVRPKRANVRKRPRASFAEDDDEEEDDDAALEAMMFADEHAPPKKKAKSANPAVRKGPQSRAEIVAKGLRPAFNAVYANDDYAVFKSEPNLREAPDYYNVVPNPIWMAKIRQKLEKKQYSEPEQLLADMELIRDNCFLYNRDRYPLMLSFAQQFFDTFFDEYQAALPAVKQQLADFEAARAAQQAQAAANPQNLSVGHGAPTDANYASHGAVSDHDIQVD
eukprot:TRINITY_DN872_c0_g3_i1.p1 TRINITY_DN872_c0_g3~~TRINITY_DN872_c0_g3_i1.p1  ORF type:complete len:1601 (+),score=441.51 TRINITY_DN872_c0_g3_i1:185-4987(+)